MSYSDIKEAARDLTKLALNGSPRWRLLVSGSLLVLAGVTTWGYYTYARASEVDEKIETAISPLRSDITSIKQEQRKKSINDLTDSILAAKRDQCDAVREGRAAQAWTKRIFELSRQYFEIVGQSPEIPTCEQV